MRRHWPHVMVGAQAFGALGLGLACSHGLIGWDLTLLLVLGSLGIAVAVTDSMLERAEASMSRLADVRLMAMFATAQAVLLCIGQSSAGALLQSGAMVIVLVLAVLGLMRIGQAAAWSIEDRLERRGPDRPTP